MQTRPAPEPVHPGHGPGCGCAATPWDETTRVPLVRRRVAFELGPLRWLGVAMLGLGALWPSLPWHPQVACPLLASTGVPCPLCGMTRSVAAAARGDLGASLAYSPGGLVAVVVALGLVLAWRVRRLAVPLWVLLGSFALLWAWNVSLNPTF